MDALLSRRRHEQEIGAAAQENEAGVAGIRLYRVLQVHTVCCTGVRCDGTGVRLGHEV